MSTTLQLRTVDRGMNPASLRELVRLMAHIDAGYLTANPALPCCPSCAGITREEDGVVKDVAHCIADGTGNSVSLAAWHLAEAWNAGDGSADVTVGDNGEYFDLTISKNGEPIEIATAYRLPEGSFCGCS